MRFSKSLLQDKDIGKKIFNSSIEKTKQLLSDIFELDFTVENSMIKEVIKDDYLYFFKMIFNFKNREISATLNYEPEEIDVVQETLNISEIVEEEIQIKDIPNDYQKAINKVMDILEEKYEINFTPLNPSEIDNNIKNINNQNFCWEVIFIHNDHEGEFKAIYTHNEKEGSSLTVIEHKQHIIFFE